MSSFSVIAALVGAAVVSASPVAVQKPVMRLKVNDPSSWHATLMQSHFQGASEHMHRAVALNITANLKDTPSWHMLAGIFVSPCIPLECEFNIPSLPLVTKCSMIHSAQYAGSVSDVVKNDVTIYVKDDQCKPVDSEILAKFEYNSLVTYSGNSNFPPNHGGTKVSYKILGGTYQFSFPPSLPSAGATEFFAALNAECPCKGHWGPKAVRTINPGQDCGPGDHAKENATSTGDLCNFVVGNTEYLTLKWVNGNTVISSDEKWDSRDGYGTPFNMTYAWSLLPITGVRDPKLCDYILWPKCKEGVNAAIATCTSCATTLECEQCVFREMPVTLGREYEWTECCPCLMYEGNKQQLPWMQYPSLKC